MPDRYDLAVLGGGPAGYVAAIRASQLGRKTAVIEQDLMGGTCLNRGCIPTKTLIASASLYRHGKNSARFGLSGSLEMDYAAVAKRRDMVVTRLRKGIEAHFKHLGIDIIRGHGLLKSADLLSVEGKEISAGNVLLAPGSVPVVPGFMNVDGIMTSREVLAMTELPESMIIIGGGVIGCEFASILSSFGVAVTIVEMLPEILPGIDSDVTALVAKSLKKSKVKIHTGQAASSVDITPGKGTVTLADGTVLNAEKVLVSIGRSSKTGDCGFQEAGLEMDERGNIVTGDFGSTSLPGVYAAGDATGLWQLAHAGSAQGVSAVHAMFHGPERRMNADAMSGCIFTFPEIATVGPGEDEWRQRGADVKVSTARYMSNGKALGMNETQGFVKLVADSATDEIKGVQIVGADASSLVGWAVMAVNSGIKASRAASFVHPHPTLCEIFMEASEGMGIGSIHG